MEKGEEKRKDKAMTAGGKPGETKNKRRSGDIRPEDRRNGRPREKKDQDAAQDRSNIPCRSEGEEKPHATLATEKKAMTQQGGRSREKQHRPPGKSQKRDRSTRRNTPHTRIQRKKHATGRIVTWENRPGHLPYRNPTSRTH